MKKHFQITITDTTFTYTRNTDTIAAEAALDGFYILRTSLTENRPPEPGMSCAPTRTSNRPKERSGH